MVKLDKNMEINNLQVEQNPSEDIVLEEVKPKKRGRKPNPNSKMYFGEREEKAFALYIETDDEFEREVLFNEILKPAFTKMIESIMRRYNLFTPDEDFEITFNDTFSYLMTKASHYSPDRNTKAFSYCGTICKNYLLYKRSKTMKTTKKILPYEKVYNDSNPDLRTTSDEELGTDFHTELINRTVKTITDLVDNDSKTNQLSENEKKVGNAIIQLLTTWKENDIPEMDFQDAKKFNKSTVLYFLRENTFLGTKEIRSAMKKFKNVYFNTKDEYLNE